TLARSSSWEHALSCSAIRSTPTPNDCLRRCQCPTRVAYANRACGSPERSRARYGGSATPPKRCIWSTLVTGTSSQKIILTSNDRVVNTITSAEGAFLPPHSAPLVIASHSLLLRIHSSGAAGRCKPPARRTFL